MCKHRPTLDRGSGGWQPYILHEKVYNRATDSYEPRERERGILLQPICAICGLVMGLPKVSKPSAPYRMAAADLAKKYNLTKVQRRLISQKLQKIDDEAATSKLERENVFVDAFRNYSSIPQIEIEITLRKV